MSSNSAPQGKISFGAIGSTLSANKGDRGKLPYNDNESKTEIFIKTTYQLNMKITITVPKINLFSISPLTAACERP